MFVEMKDGQNGRVSSQMKSQKTTTVNKMNNREKMPMVLNGTFASPKTKATITQAGGLEFLVKCGIKK